MNEVIETQNKHRALLNVQWHNQRNQKITEKALWKMQFQCFSMKEYKNSFNLPVLLLNFPKKEVEKLVKCAVRRKVLQRE